MNPSMLLNGSTTQVTFLVMGDFSDELIDF
jgi:hypothetical protein